MAEIKLTNGGVTMVDDADVTWLSRFRWRITHHGYVERNPRRRPCSMHRLILSATDGVEVDHIDGNPLNNMRANLRLATRNENARNTGPLPFRKHGQPFKGISRERAGWRAQVSPGRVQVYLGHFDSPEEAARAYDRAAIAHYGRFARLNFPEEGGVA